MNEQHDANAAEAARVQAEARRKRILEKANKRIGVVSGEEALPEEDKKASEAKAARIRAARQRRYGKKSTDAAPVTSNDEPKDESPSEPPATPAEPVASTEDDPKEDPPKTAEKSVVEEETKKPVEESKASATVVEPTTSSTSDEPKKKYVGVARMRRNMIKNKKNQEDTSEPGEDSAAAPAGAATEISVDPKHLPGDPLRAVTRVPIYMHIVTILMMFFAGMDVSIQQYHHHVEVDTSFAVSQHGLPLIHRSFKPPAFTGPSKAELLENLKAANSGAGEAEVLNEFEEDETEKIPNIDPVFGVDLDELTKGPGFLNQLARGAVGMHRSILWLVYFGPIGILQMLISMPRALLRSPPALCLVALVLRHLVGKGLLGAGIPEPSTAGEKGGGIDLLAMAKTFVTNFFNNNFPTAVGLYGAFTHLRSDMYVILCGVFSGLVYVHLLASAAQPEGDVRVPANDEL